MGSIAGDFTGTAHEDLSEDKLETQLGMNQEFNHDLIPENTKLLGLLHQVLGFRVSLGWLFDEAPRRMSGCPTLKQLTHWSPKYFSWVQNHSQYGHP